MRVNRSLAEKLPERKITKFSNLWYQCEYILKNGVYDNYYYNDNNNNNNHDDHHHYHHDIYNYN